MEDENSENRLLRGQGSHLWKRFMVTDLERIEKVSGELHSRAQPKDVLEIGMFPGKENMTKLDGRQARQDEGKKADVYHDPEPEPMPKPEITIKKPPKELGLAGREVFLRPALPFESKDEQPGKQLLPSRSQDLLFGFRNPGSRLGKSGMMVPRVKGLKDQKDVNGEG